MVLLKSKHKVSANELARLRLSKLYLQDSKLLQPPYKIKGRVGIFDQNNREWLDSVHIFDPCERVLVEKLVNKPLDMIKYQKPCPWCWWNVYFLL